MVASAGHPTWLFSVYSTRFVVRQSEFLERVHDIPSRRRVFCFLPFAPRSSTDLHTSISRSAAATFMTLLGQPSPEVMITMSVIPMEQTKKHQDHTT